MNLWGGKKVIAKYQGETTSVVVFIIGFWCYWQGIAYHMNTLAVRKEAQAKSVFNRLDSKCVLWDFIA